MRVTVSFKPNLFPRTLEASAKALAAGRPEDWWHGARERGLFSLFRLQRQLGSRWLSRSFTEQDTAASSFCRGAYPVLPPLSWHVDLDAASVDALLSGYLHFSSDLYGLLVALVDHQQRPLPEKEKERREKRSGNRN